MHKELYIRWETTHKWYEARLLKDLLGQWVVFRTWGAKDSQRQGRKSSYVETYKKGCDLITAISHKRLKRSPAYQLKTQLV